MRELVRRAAASAALFSFISSAPAGEPFPWPIRGAPALTSTFAEYRAGRLHAGVDIKTWGQEGYPCLSVGDGYVARVRTSPWGYGKAVYLTLNDGRQVVYAHLSAFSAKIEEVVRQEQDRRGAYSVNLFLDSASIPVRKGEVIAHSGSTGAGYPHLHFELRDARGRPVNALSHGLDVADTLPPTITGIAFVPLDEGARVNGSALPQAFAVGTDGKTGQPRGPGAVGLHGRVGVAVKAHDRADASASGNRLAPYRLVLQVNGKDVFRTTYLHFGYDEVYQVDLDRSYPLLRMGEPGYHNLFLCEGNDLPFYGRDLSGDGVLRAGAPAEGDGPFLPLGEHRIAVVAEDARGNCTALTTSVVVGGGDASGGAGAASRAPAAEGLVAFDRFSVLSLRAQVPPEVSLTFEDSAAGETAGQPLPLLAPGGGRFEVVIPTGAWAGRRARLRASGVGPQGRAFSIEKDIRPTRVDGEGATVSSGDGQAVAVFGKGAVYGPVVVQVEPAPPREPGGVVGRPFRFFPGMVSFRRPVQVWIKVPEGTPRPEKLGLYERKDDGWTFVWNDRDTSAGTVGAGVRHFSTYALIPDERAPDVSDLVPAPGARVARRPEIAARMRDAQSGIRREEDISFTLDGAPLIFEYDPEAERATARPRRDLAPGPHRVEVRVRDTSGNEAVLSGTFVVTAG